MTAINIHCCRWVSNGHNSLINECKLRCKNLSQKRAVQLAHFRSSERNSGKSHLHSVIGTPAKTVGWRGKVSTPSTLVKNILLQSIDTIHQRWKICNSRIQAILDKQQCYCIEYQHGWVSAVDKKTRAMLQANTDAPVFQKPCLSLGKIPQMCCLFHLYSAPLTYSVLEHCENG